MTSAWQKRKTIGGAYKVAIIARTYLTTFLRLANNEGNLANNTADAFLFGGLHKNASSVLAVSHLSLR